jgi:ribosome-binding factor A
MGALEDLRMVRGRETGDQRSGRGAGGELNQRQLRVGERVRHVLSDMFSKGAVHDPAIAETPITVSEVRISRDLRQATVFVVELGGHLSDDVKAALERATPFLRGEVARQSNLKYAPMLTFRADESFAESARIDALLAEARRDRPGLHLPDVDSDDEGSHG